MLNGLIWVIVIFVLQAVIAGLAKRAQQNAQQKPPNGAQPTTGDLIDPTQPVRAANAPKKAKLPKVADASTVVVKRPTSIVTGKRSATATTTSAAKVQRSATGATGKSVSAPPTARPAPVAVIPPKVTPPRVVARPEAPEEADAMASRAKVAASIARIRSIESSVSSSHVAGLGKTVGKPISTGTQSTGSGTARQDALTPAAIAQSLRNPQRIREAIIVSEVLGPPRGMR
jgi:hypothetical protein